MGILAKSGVALPENSLVQWRSHAGCDSICQPCVSSDTYGWTWGTSTGPARAGRASTPLFFSGLC